MIKINKPSKEEVEQFIARAVEEKLVKDIEEDKQLIRNSRCLLIDDNFLIGETLTFNFLEKSMLYALQLKSDKQLYPRTKIKLIKGIIEDMLVSKRYFTYVKVNDETAIKFNRKFFKNETEKEIEINGRKERIKLFNNDKGE
jgi:hypothetical protein